MKNQRYTENKHIALPADKDYKSGDPAAIGVYRGVVVADAAEGERVTIWLDGSYDIPVTGALTVGQAVYLAGNGTLTATAGATPWGAANVAKATGTAPAEVAPLGMIPGATA